MCRAIGLVLAVVACSAKGGVVFHATDVTFSPSPGAAPRVFAQANIAEVPNETMHSVGLIEVTFTRRHVHRAYERAREKGRELGCWIVIEHTAFEELGARASRIDGVAIILVHGGPPHTPNVRVRDGDVMQFDCVVRGAATKSADQWQRSRSLQVSTVTVGIGKTARSASSGASPTGFQADEMNLAPRSVPGVQAPSSFTST